MAAAFVAAQNPSPRVRQPVFRQVGQAQGLVGEQVRALLRDPSGVLWIGTEQALNRFDMYSCVPVGLMGEDQAEGGRLEVTGLELLEGRLWVGTRRGLYFLDREKGMLAPARSLLQDAAASLELPVLCLAKDSRGRLWIGCRGALVYIEPGARSLGTIGLPASLFPERPRTTQVACMSFLLDGDALWIGTENHGLYSLDLEDLRLTRHSLRLPGGQEAFMVACLHRTSSERLWVGTTTIRGLLEYDPRDRTVRFVGLAAWKGWPRHPVVTSICEDSHGRTWLGTSSKGVFVLPAEGLGAIALRSVPDSKRSLPNDRIRVLYRDASNTLWIGTNAGACVVDDLMAPFRSHVSSLPEDMPKKEDHEVSVQSIWKDENGKVWVGTHGQGLQALDPETDRHLRREQSPEQRSLTDKVSAVYRDRAGVLWVGGYGLFRMEGSAFRSIALPEMERAPAPVLENPKLGIQVMNLYEDSTGRLWVNLYHRLCVLSVDRTSWRSIALEKPAANLVEDGDGRIWVATIGAGLLEIDPELDTLRYHRHDPKRSDGPPGDTLRYVTRGKGTGLWFTWEKGLCSFDIKTGKCKGYPFAESVHGVAMDAGSKLWLAARTALIRFDPETRHSKVFDQFDLERLGGFRRHVIHRAQDGELFFGRDRGITRVDPRALQESHPDPELRLSTIRVMDRVLWPGSSELAANQLTVGHTQSHVSIAVSDLDAFHREDRRFAFRLAGLESEWMESEVPRVTYAELPPGEYRLELRKSRGGTIWTEARELLGLRVLPPLWDRAWFRWSALLALLLGGGFLFQRRAGSEARQRRRLDKAVGERTRELQGRTDELEGVQHFLSTISAPVKLGALLDRVLAGVLDLVGIERGRVLVRELGSGLFRIRAAVGWEDHDLLERWLSPEEAQQTYLQGAVDLGQGLLLIFEDRIVKTTHPSSAPRIDTYVLPIQRQGEAEAFLLLDSEVSAGRLAADRLHVLQTLRGPITWAFTRTQLVEELTELNDRRNEIMGMAAHDLKNPLHRLTLAASVLLEDLESGRKEPEGSGKEIEYILRSADQMADLLDQLLSTAAAEKGGLELHKTPVNLAEFVRERVKLIEKDAARKEIRLKVEAPDEVPEVLADRVQLAAVADNLLSNAVKFTEPGGRVLVYWEASETSLTTHVKDSGQGLPEKDMSELFTTFKPLSARPTAGEPSTGLGLAIVKRITERHGGRVWARSRVGAGSTFSFSLPIAELAVSQAGPSSDLDPPS